TCQQAAARSHGTYRSRPVSRPYPAPPTLHPLPCTPLSRWRAPADPHLHLWLGRQPTLELPPCTTRPPRLCPLPTLHSPPSTRKLALRPPPIFHKLQIFNPPTLHRRPPNRREPRPPFQPGASVSCRNPLPHPAPPPLLRARPGPPPPLHDQVGNPLGPTYPAPSLHHGRNAPPGRPPTNSKPNTTTVVPPDRPL
ncbi:hypothetical protein MCOR29_011717, partial [Pyricularia oryzae]